MNIGIYCALGGALLFGASTPLAKILLGEIPPVALAGLPYAGSGVGLGLVLLLRGRGRAGSGRPHFAKGDYKWLAGVLFFGGILGPVLLMYGLASTSASNAALLLNLEGVLTALLAWFVFRENFDARVLLGMILIIGGGAFLGWRPGAGSGGWPALAIACACACWALDNNLTRKLSSGDAVALAALKGGVAGAVNLSLAALLGFRLPPGGALAAGLVGALGYGASLALFVVALRHLGAARTGAYFSTAPFVGAALSLGLPGERADSVFWIAASLMGAGVLLHLTERHQHTHRHDALTHWHPHSHDAHHQHTHDPEWDGVEPHAHAHDHETLSHSHAHYPDIHHRHVH